MNTTTLTDNETRPQQRTLKQITLDIEKIYKELRGYNIYHVCPSASEAYWFTLDAHADPLIYELNEYVKRISAPLPGSPAN
jgi:hypothetical protein